VHLPEKEPKDQLFSLIGTNTFFLVYPTEV